MSSTSSPRSLADNRLDVVRLSDDPADDEANAAATKVGPMSQAFVDRLMFKAQVAESVLRPSRPVTAPPQSGVRATVAHLDEVMPHAPGLTPGKLPALWDEAEELPLEATVVVDSAPPAASATPQPTQPSAKPFPGVAQVADEGPCARPLPSAPPRLFVEPAISVSAARWMAGSGFYNPAEQPRDWRLAIEVATVLGSLGVTIAAVVVFLF